MSAGHWLVLLCGALGVVVLIATQAVAQEPRPRVLTTSVAAAITPPVADHLTEAVERAERGGYDALVVRLDTPGGLDTSMRSIVRSFLAARVPVIVHVAPSGARAASAGAILTFSAHVAAMAPGTAIGAATPVDLHGGDVGDKVINDAAALVESIARQRGRNVEFAVDTVRGARSAAADEAAEIGAVDLVAGPLSELLRQADGRIVRLGPEGQEVAVRSAGASVEEFDISLFRRIQQALADPNLAFIFMSLGTLGLVYELASPGVGVSGALGVMFVLLGLFSLSVLPVNVVGLLFLLLAAVLFVAELFAPGIGVSAAGGALALALGAVFLFRDVPGVGVSVGVLAPVTVTMGGAVVLAGRLAARSVRAAPTSGTESFVGRTASVRRADGKRGQAFLEGAWWNVRSADAELEVGADVRIVDVEGLDLVVAPLPKDPSCKEENHE
ncbi:MAG: nodulation protein NfeD [Actinomycetota bacterium]|nr:nodulation protein NfeD [Actinomycetota bacterium]